MTNRNCPYCGTALTGQQKQKCGAADCKRQWNAARCREQQRRYRAEAKARGERYGDCGPEQACEVCGETFTNRRPSEAARRRTCSKVCQGELNSRILAEKRPGTSVVLYVGPAGSTQLPEAHPARRLDTRRSKRQWVNGVCRDCGDPFTAVDFTSGLHLPLACSLACQQRLCKDRRRARQREAFVANVSRRDVYERDGWRCGICLGLVPKKYRDHNIGKRYPHGDMPDLAPVLDHIIPLAKGGTHEPRNVQLAHVRCNYLKGDRAAGSQLRVV